MAELRNCNHCPTRIDGIFCSLAPKHLDDLNRAKTTNRYQRGQVLFYEGNPPSGLFCVASGQVKIFKNGAEGKEVILRIAKAGDVVGFRSVISGEDFRATAQALEESVVCFVGQQFFSHLVSHENEVALKVLQRIGQELNTVEDRVSDLANKNVHQRLSKLLLTLRTTHGKKGGDGVLIDIRLSRADLASMIGATPETVIRMLSEFKDQGYVDLKGKQIIIRNPEGLMREADLDV